RRGGQNMIEPAALGVPVIVGPNTSNFRDVVEGLRSVQGIEVVPAAEQLPPAVRSLLSDDLRARRQSASARRFVLAQQGAADRTLQLMQRILEPRAASRRAA